MIIILIMLVFFVIFYIYTKTEKQNSINEANLSKNIIRSYQKGLITVQLRNHLLNLISIGEYKRAKNIMGIKYKN